MSEMILEESTSIDILMESPDLNRFTSTPQYIEPLSVPANPSPSISICPTQFFVMDAEEWARNADGPGGSHLSISPIAMRIQGNDGTGSLSQKMSPTRQKVSPNLMSPNQTAPVQGSPQIIQHNVRFMPPVGPSHIVQMPYQELAQSPVQGEQVNTFVALEERSKKRKRPTNPLGHFLVEEKNKLVNKSANLDLDSAMLKWESFDDAQKKKYQKLFEQEREKIYAQNPNETKTIKKVSESAKEEKKERDRQYMAKKRLSASDKLKEEELNREKLKKMVKTKTEKINKMNSRTETKKSELSSRKTELKMIEEEIKAKEMDEMNFKDRYKEMYKHHNVCSRK